MYPLAGRKQSKEHIDKRVLTRKLNNSYAGQNKGHPATNLKPNSGSFKKGLVPWNTGKGKKLDFEYIKQKHIEEGVSIRDLGKELGVSDSLIRIRLKENNLPIRPRWSKHTSRSRLKIVEARSKQVFPMVDSSIEVKLQNFLKQLNIQFYTHQYMREIEHRYQCDIFIPKQEGILKDTIIECFGVYWHNYPYGKEIDAQRCNELRDKGYRVLVFWENEIKEMQLEDLDNVL